MKHYKNINNGYITSISTGAGQIEITKQEYNKILEVIRNKPIIAENGYDYRLKENLTWELYELPESASADEWYEITDIEYNRIMESEE